MQVLCCQQLLLLPLHSRANPIIDRCSCSANIRIIDCVGHPVLQPVLISYLVEIVVSAAHLLGRVAPQLQPMPSEAELEALSALQRPEPNAYFLHPSTLPAPLDWCYQVQMGLARISDAACMLEVLSPSVVKLVGPKQCIWWLGLGHIVAQIVSYCMLVYEALVCTSHETASALSAGGQHGGQPGGMPGRADLRAAASGRLWRRPTGHPARRADGMYIMTHPLNAASPAGCAFRCHGVSHCSRLPCQT